MSSSLAVRTGPPSVSALLAAASSELGEVTAGLDAAELAIAADRTIAGPTSSLRHLALEQRIGGVPIRGSYLQLLIGDSAGQPAILAASYRVYQHPRVDVAPEIDRAAAVELARDRLRVGPGPSPRISELAIRQVDGTLRLAWEITFAESDERAVVLGNGAERGRVVVVDDRVYHANGVVRGFWSAGGAPGGKGSATLVPLARLRLEGGQNGGVTGNDGSFAIDDADYGTPVVAALSGEVVKVSNYEGGELSVEMAAAEGMSITLGQDAEHALAQVTAYHAVSLARKFLVANGASEATFGAPIEAIVNRPSTCNAYYSPTARTINFFKSGGGCNNSAEASIVAHEYGHFVDDLYGGIIDGGLSEGWGDVIACLMLGDPIVGGDLFQDGSSIRSCDNDYEYPASGSDEVHDLGQAWSGFVWHLREALIVAHGPSAGDALARKLVLPALAANAPDIPSAVRMAVLLDDDDGDLSNKTPNWAALLQAAERHALDFVLDSDLVAPAKVDDLEALQVTSTSVTLGWTAPGDDEDSGTAAKYDLRYASAPITEESFSLATPVPAPDPAPAGSVQQTTISVGPGPATLYVAVKTADEAGNWSPLSASVAVTLPSPTVIYSDGAEDGIGSWEASGLWHVTERAAASGTRSFWYGIEASGTYDTGSPSSGVLVSEVIDLAGVDEPRLAFAERIQVESGAIYDKLTVEVFDVDDPSVKAVVDKDTGSTAGNFRQRLISLAGLAGRRVRIRFSFDTVDGTANALEGWYVDDVRILAEGGAAPSKGLLINEVLADPPSGYDANNDGVYSYRDDEFIELLNTGSATIDLSGATVADGVRTRMVLPDGLSIEPGEVLVLFGGGAPNLPGVATLASEGLFLNNGGDVIRIRDAQGELLAEMSYGAEGGKNTSLVRQDDGDASAPFVSHQDLAGQPASPGKRSNGDPFGDEPPAPSPASGLVINEVLADPPVGYDANGDGVYHYHQDEFVELVNTGALPIDLGGASVHDTVGVRAVLPDGLMLQPGEALVLFGGGTPSISYPGVIVMAAEHSLQLNNGGDSITIRDRDGALLVAMTYSDDGGKDQSLVRSTELDPTASWVLHSEVGSDPASPGLRADGTPLSP